MMSSSCGRSSSHFMVWFRPTNTASVHMKKGNSFWLRTASENELSLSHVEATTKKRGKCKTTKWGQSVLPNLSLMSSVALKEVGRYAGGTRKKEPKGSNAFS